MTQKLNRRETALAIRDACGKYYAKKLYALSYELQLNRASRKSPALRADIIALSMKKQVIIVEVKSSWADFKTDTKYPNYLPYCNKLYIACPAAIAERVKAAVPKEVGVMSWPSLRIIKSARQSPVDPETFEKLLMRMVFRRSELGKRKNA